MRSCCCATARDSYCLSTRTLRQRWWQQVCSVAMMLVCQDVYGKPAGSFSQQQCHLCQGVWRRAWVGASMAIASQLAFLHPLSFVCCILQCPLQTQALCGSVSSSFDFSAAEPVTASFGGSMPLGRCPEPSSAHPITLSSGTLRSYACSTSGCLYSGVIPIDRLTDVRAPIEVVLHQAGIQQIQRVYNISVPRSERRQTFPICKPRLTSPYTAG